VAIDAAHQQGILHQVGVLVATHNVTRQNLMHDLKIQISAIGHVVVLQAQDDKSEEEDEDYFLINADASDGSHVIAEKIQGIHEEVQCHRHDLMLGKLVGVLV
jgi:hypothetical protein